MEERFAVTAATGALGPVLVKLTALLGDEYKLHEKTREDILFIKSELDRVHDLLVKIWGRLDLNVACKDWMTEARELSYDMEDDIDSFTLGLEFMGDGSFIQRETTDGPFKELMVRVKGVSKRYGKMQKIGDAIICNDGSKLSTDPRALFLHNDASELVGMEAKKEELIKLLQKHEMVCIVGPGGMGKTTLADLVYHAVGDEFQCRAFVSVHPSPNMMEIMGAILSQVRDGVMSAGSGTEPAAEQNMINSISISLSEKSGTEHAAEQYDFIKGISTFLSDNRYLIIIDDIWHWEEWEVILKALPQNNLDRKLMMTTRVRSIAGKCSTEQGAHVYEQKFGYEESERLSAMRLSESVKGTNAKELPTLIADMCDEPPFHCCPLAVICLSSAWAESHNVQGDDGEWDTWASHVLDDGFLSTPSLKPLVQSLCLGFDDLPVQLRTCLLYCTIYPPEYMFYKGCLLRKWIAEGFVSQVEVAEAYFDKLASRNLLLMCMGKYTVDHIMRAFLVRKGEEDNFIAYYYHGPSDSSHGKQIRRLSLSTDRCLDEDVLSHIRSLVVCGKQWQLDGVPFKAFKKLRVLEIRDRSGLENGHLVDVCGLMRLKYLCLGNCDQITELPREIGRLQNLETLDVRGTCVGKLPTEIGKLQHLRTLDIRGTKVREVSFIEGPNSLLSVVVDSDRFYGHKVKLPLGVISSSGGEAKYRKYLSILILINHFSDDRCDVGPVRMLRVAGRHMKVPQWVKQYLCNVSSLDIRLCKLVEEDLEFLKTQMPNLHALQLRFEVLPREPVSITRGGFPKLEIFYIDCRLPRVINFKEGAMPKLKHLEFKFYSGPATSQDYSMGIMCLSSLQRVVFRCSEYYTSDGPGISATIEVVRKEAAQHPNKITLYINDMDPELFGSGAEWLSQANKATIRKEIEERERIRQQINRKEIEERERIRKQRDRLYSAAKRRAQQEKNNARGRIHS
ncbi:unnamed protein product [Urochloa decumbens]|uniref:AAA+ ATPase domain-containing protein n=1 Tax=Urochloa decumbens TaxID=240449 RepID=A0ABC9ANR0_9POAL